MRLIGQKNDSRLAYRYCMDVQSLAEVRTGAEGRDNGGSKQVIDSVWQR